MAEDRALKLLGKRCQLTYLAREAIYAVDEQDFDPRLPRQIEGGLEARPVEPGATRLVLVVAIACQSSCPAQVREWQRVPALPVVVTQDLEDDGSLRHRRCRRHRRTTARCAIVAAAGTGSGARAAAEDPVP